MLSDVLAMDFYVFGQNQSDGFSSHSGNKALVTINDLETNRNTQELKMIDFLYKLYNEDQIVETTFES